MLKASQGESPPDDEADDNVGHLEAKDAAGKKMNSSRTSDRDGGDVSDSGDVLNSAAATSIVASTTCETGTPEAEAKSSDAENLADQELTDGGLVSQKEKRIKLCESESDAISDVKTAAPDSPDWFPDAADYVKANDPITEDFCDAVARAEASEDADVESNFATIDISDDPVTLKLDEVTPRCNIDEASDAVVYVETSRDMWHPVFEIRRREMGYSRRYDGTSAFARKACGSVNLVQRLTRYTTLNGHSGCVNALHFNESGTLLASGSDDLYIYIWNWVESKPFFSFDSGHRSNVFQCKFMPFTGDCHLVSCARDGQVRLAELSTTGTCRGTRKLAYHRGAAHKLALLPDSSHIFYSCGEDAVAYEIDLRQDKPNRLCVTKENNRKIELYSIHANPFKSHEFVVGGRDYYVRIYDARNINEEVNAGVLKKFCPQHMVGTESKANITCAVYNFNGTEILGSYNDEDIYLFDNTASEAKNHHLRKYTGHRNSATVKGINFYGPKSEFVVSGSDCGNVFLWERSSEKILNYFAADEGGVVNVLEPHPHFAILATSGLDHDVKVWMPLAEPTDLNGLEEVVKKNTKERENDRSQPDDIDSHMIWLLMRHLRRTTRRRVRNLDEEPGSSSSENSVEMEDEEDGEDGEDQDGPTQCNPS